MQTRWQEITAPIADACAAAGLDLVHPFQVGWYNDAVDAAYRLPDFDRPHALGLLIGNTRALWAPFRAALRDQPALRDDPNPLERYTAACVLAALRPLVQRSTVRWAHDPPPRRPAMQRLGHVSGLAHLSPCQLNVHPVYGPWIALRCAVVIDVDGPSGPLPEPPNPCSDCAQTCVPAFERAAAALRQCSGDQPGLGDTWHLWLAVRDACPLGRAHRYGDEQIAYHYRNDRRVLRP